MIWTKFRAILNKRVLRKAVMLLVKSEEERAYFAELLKLFEIKIALEKRKGNSINTPTTTDVHNESNITIKVTSENSDKEE